MVIVNIDLHIHSKYSAATSKDMSLIEISNIARKKGIHVVGTGDCLHPIWYKEIKKLQLVDEGTYELNGTRFVLTTEVEDCYRVHHILIFPNISAIDQFTDLIKGKGNLESDGRAKLNLTGEIIAEYAKQVEVLIGPAHAFTPWTALYAYHDSLKSCYKDLTDYISFVELGLSANTDYADRISELHKLTFLTNSDAHSASPLRFAREFNRLEIKIPNFVCIKDAILRKSGNIILNIGIPPEEGKYNESACIKCFAHYKLQDAINMHWRCSCGGRIKKGVVDRVNELADFLKPKHPTHRPPYLSIVPLIEIIKKSLNTNAITKKVLSYWDTLIQEFSNEVEVMLYANPTIIEKLTNKKLLDTLLAFRNQQFTIQRGGGGRYGEIIITRCEQKSIINYINA